MRMPQGNTDHRPSFPHCRPSTHRILSVTPPSRHLLGEPLPLSPCPARPLLSIGAYPGRHFRPRPPGCRWAPRHIVRGDRTGTLARPRQESWAVGRSTVGRSGCFDSWPRPTVPDREGHHTSPQCGRGPNVKPRIVPLF
jgi:hypothetical protein